MTLGNQKGKGCFDKKKKKLAKDEIFFQIHDIRDDEIPAKSRYLAVHILPQDHIYFVNSTPHLWSLLYFNVCRYERSVSLSFICFRKLRVLDLENLCIECLPQGIGKVRLLRYLSLRDSVIK